MSMLRMAGRSVRTLSIDHRVNMPELVSPRLLEQHPDLWRRLDAVQDAEGFSAKAGTRQLLAAARFRMKPHLKSLPARRLVAVGKEDRLVPPANSRKLAQLLSVPLEVLAGRHHDLSLDAPETVAELLFRVTGA
jgi:pimeloyl-ACP methyl ester carboxylesterase